MRWPATNPAAPETYQLKVSVLIILATLFITLYGPGNLPWKPASWNIDILSPCSNFLGFTILLEGTYEGNHTKESQNLAFGLQWGSKGWSDQGSGIVVAAAAQE